MNIFQYYSSAKNANLKPSLIKFGSLGQGLIAIGIGPADEYKVKDGILYKNNDKFGSALDIFKILYFQKNSENFFPCFMGFFSYEFAHYFEKKVSFKNTIFPEAFFRQYQKGLVILNGQVIHHDPVELSDWAPSQLPDFSRAENIHANKAKFLKSISNIQEQISLGNVYQVNLSQPFLISKESSLDPLSLFHAMCQYNPSPYMALMEGDDWSIICGSPERLFSLKNGELNARPIAGTKKRPNFEKEDETVQTIKTCPKENAEHAMLVDLMRNDINAIAEPTSVYVSEDRTVEFYSHVMHLVSSIKGQTTSNLESIFRAIFPGGTITGAPKLEVMKAIATEENLARGPYTGSMGYVSAGFGCDFNIAIRTALKHKDQTWINAGAGIVINSIPEQEWQEINNKAQFVLDIISNKSAPKPVRFPIVGINSLEPQIKLNKVKSKLLFIENYDSFSFNIINLLKILGADVAILKAHSDLPKEAFSHIVLGPGPGNPKNLKSLSKWIEWADEKHLPFLGICLGHQALGAYFGGEICEVNPVHGECHSIKHNGQALFQGLPNPSSFTRYHSLALKNLPNDFELDAQTSEGIIMAIRHRNNAFFGVQFHPESYLSKDGAHLLHNFLRIK